jgi:hypothetical protein
MLSGPLRKADESQQDALIKTFFDSALASSPSISTNVRDISEASQLYLRVVEAALASYRVLIENPFGGVGYVDTLLPNEFTTGNIVNLEFPALVFDLDDDGD